MSPRRKEHRVLSSKVQRPSNWIFLDLTPELINCFLATTPRSRKVFPLTDLIADG